MIRTSRDDCVCSCYRLFVHLIILMAIWYISGELLKVKSLSVLVLGYFQPSWAGGKEDREHFVQCKTMWIRVFAVKGKRYFFSVWAGERFSKRWGLGIWPGFKGCVCVGGLKYQKDFCCFSGVLEIYQWYSGGELWGDKLQSSWMAFLAKRESCMDWWLLSVKGLAPYAGACVLQTWFPWVSKATCCQDSDRHLPSTWVGNSQWCLQNAFVNTSTLYRKACSGENQSPWSEASISQSLTWGSLGYSSGFEGSSRFVTQAAQWPVENTKGYLCRGKPLGNILRVENALNCIDSEMPFYLQFQFYPSVVPEGDPHMGVLWSLSCCRVLTDSLLWVSKSYLERLIGLQWSQPVLFLFAQRAVKTW